MKLATWNVNGIRAAQKGGFLDWLHDEAADVVALQEIKAFPDQLDLQLVHPENYQTLWNPAKKPGYSGTAIYTRKAPVEVLYGMGIPEFDDEGRVLVAEYKEFVLINAYFPNAQRDHARLDYKLRFCKAMKKFCDAYVKKGRSVVLCGDYNIAHNEIDLRNPKSNMNNSGFLPQERAWMDQFTSSGYVDVFRRQTGDAPHHYTWWSYRPGVRERNIGWRIDYHCVNEDFLDRVKKASHQPEVRGSDHCPVVLQLKK